MDSHKLIGCGTALITPFKVNGDVDYDAYVRLVQRQIEADIDFLVPLGSTAETPCLEDDEKVKLLHITKEIAKGKIVVAGAGTNSYRHTLNNMRLLSEADMYLLVVPYYNKPTQRGQYEYFKALAEDTDKPIMLYNVPGRTGANMTAETTLRLAEIDNIIAIKEASGNLDQVRTIIKNAPRGFKVFSGNDDQTLEIVHEGGAGVVSVASNVVPGLMTDMVNTALFGSAQEAFNKFRKLIPLFDACFVESNPIPVKGALHLMGLIDNVLRLPLTTCEPSTLDIMAETLKLLELK